METDPRIRWLFITSVWLFVALSGYAVIVRIMTAENILGAYPGGYDLRVLLAPFLLLSAELFLRFRFFRRPRPPARIFAGFVGVYILLMIVFVNLVVSDLYDREASALRLWLYAYAGGGHLAFAFLGKERTAGIY